MGQSKTGSWVPFANLCFLVLSNSPSLNTYYVYRKKKIATNLGKKREIMRLLRR